MSEPNKKELLKLEEKKNRQLMNSMWILMIASTIFVVGIFGISTYLLEEGLLLGCILTITIMVYILIAFYAVKMEVDAGYYECSNCKHRFVPKYFTAIMAPHFGTTRHMKCPNCDNKSWCKKVMTKEELK